MSLKLNKLRYLFLIWLFSFSASYAQQILNPSFEQGAIPNAKGQLHLATYWTHYLGDCMKVIDGNVNTYPSSDLFDVRTTNSAIDVPHNSWTTPSGLAERTGKNRYAGIWSEVSNLNVAPDDERIRGTLSAALQAGSYDLSLYLARGKSHLSPDPVNLYNVEVVLRKGDDCTAQKVIYTTPSITHYQWQQYTTTFTITNTEANIYNKVEIRLKHYSYDKFGAQNVRTVFIDDVSISPVVCTLNSGFQHSLSCNPTSNTVTINMNSTASNPSATYQQWNIYEMNSLSTSDANIVSFLGSVMGNPQSYTVPNVAGKYYMIKHGVWTDFCPWAEQRKVFQIPVFNNSVNSDFIHQNNGSSSGHSITVWASDSTNFYSRWALFKSPTSLPVTSPNWTFISGPMPGNSYTFTGLQNGMYYKVRHVSKHNCSDYGYTDRIIYVSTNRINSVIDYQTGTISLEEIQKMEKSSASQNSNTEDLIKIYPNPAKQYVSISTLDGSGNGKITITNQYGKIVYESDLSGETLINLVDWRKGLYFVNIHTLQGKTVKKLLVE